MRKPSPYSVQSTNHSLWRMRFATSGTSTLRRAVRTWRSLVTSKPCSSIGATLLVPHRIWQTRSAVSPYSDGSNRELCGKRHGTSTPDSASSPGFKRALLACRPFPVRSRRHSKETLYLCAGFFEQPSGSHHTLHTFAGGFTIGCPALHPNALPNSGMFTTTPLIRYSAGE